MKMTDKRVHREWEMYDSKPTLKP